MKMSNLSALRKVSFFRRVIVKQKHRPESGSADIPETTSAEICRLPGGSAERDKTHSGKAASGMLQQRFSSAGPAGCDQIELAAGFLGRKIPGGGRHGLPWQAPKSGGQQSPIFQEAVDLPLPTVRIHKAAAMSPRSCRVGKGRPEDRVRRKLFMK